MDLDRHSPPVSRTSFDRNPEEKESCISNARLFIYFFIIEVWVTFGGETGCAWGGFLGTTTPDFAAKDRIWLNSKQQRTTTKTRCRKRDSWDFRVHFLFRVFSTNFKKVSSKTRETKNVCTAKFSRKTFRRRLAYLRYTYLAAFQKTQQQTFRSMWTANNVYSNLITHTHTRLFSFLFLI